MKRRYEFICRLDDGPVEGGVYVWADVTDGPVTWPVPAERQVRVAVNAFRTSTTDSPSREIE